VRWDEERRDEVASGQAKSGQISSRRAPEAARPAVIPNPGDFCRGEESVFSSVAL
jgi:hypothetical protein